ncbi:MAG TPA: hypothetical protein VNT54_16960 [Solirubrobacteraceae bacterium]|nr:hypothetical protein [Solirubrobacteraceae bacterium]
MGFLRRRKQRVPGEYPESFTRAWVQRTLPSASQAEAQSTVQHLRAKGWSEQKLAQHVLPYMPVEDPTRLDANIHGAPEAVWVPAQVSSAWFDRRLPEMTPREIRLVVEQLEGRGWSPAQTAVAVLPHLLPKLPEDDARAIVAGLDRLGLRKDEIARLARVR